MVLVKNENTTFERDQVTVETNVDEVVKGRVLVEAHRAVKDVSAFIAPQEKTTQLSKVTVIDLRVRVIVSTI